jgi:glutamyl-tRNA synthetase
MSIAHDRLSESLFPNIKENIEFYEKRYPQRETKKRETKKNDSNKETKIEIKPETTRFAPSPTGVMHVGGIYAALISERTARLSGGTFFLRVEDTDKKREIKDGTKKIIQALKNFGLTYDEGPGIDPEETVGCEETVSRDYGSYIQSERVNIYKACAKELVKRGLAYPCFCSEEDLAEIRKKQEELKTDLGYYGSWTRCRDLPVEKSIEELEKNPSRPYVIRLKSPGERREKFSRDIIIRDIIKGEIKAPENFTDIVLLKSDGVPTYHFAHVVDDHFMRVTTVIRGDEWLSSAPIHIQLFEALGFQVPAFAHIPPILKQDGSGKRKLSKRKDPEAAADFYSEKGYPRDAVLEYLLSVANSNFEDWRAKFPDAPFTEFPFKLKNISKSGALFDIDKLNFISKNVIAKMSSEEVFNNLMEWAEVYDDYILTLDKDFLKAVLSLDRDVKNPRKDLVCYSDFKRAFGYFFEEPKISGFPFKFSEDDARKFLENFLETYDSNDSQEEWFAKVKTLSAANGFAASVKEYKNNPSAYKGSVADATAILRYALTGRLTTPDLYTIINMLGIERVKNFIGKSLTI